MKVTEDRSTRIGWICGVPSAERQQSSNSLTQGPVRRPSRTRMMMSLSICWVIFSIIALSWLLDCGGLGHPAHLRTPHSARHPDAIAYHTDHRFAPSRATPYNDGISSSCSLFNNDDEVVPSLIIVKCLNNPPVRIVA